jgi:hypothetical protein
MLHRRELLKGLIAAPAIVTVCNIMPVRSIERFMGGEKFVRLSDFVYDGFNYVNSAGEKFCGSPEGLLSATIRDDKIVEQSSKVVTAFYKLGPSFLEAGGKTIWPERIGILSDSDHEKYGQHLKIAIEHWADRDLVKRLVNG